ncbi:uncharacterized protein LOC135697028 [Ochlerotatus camptorhynchus]|uniref:uncharacterized protein LOC135697028 n=1 Tax=Ochlerotatus camptorhynchus TaxID=644619 RepID=UPI0031D82F4D
MEALVQSSLEVHAVVGYEQLLAEILTTYFLGMFTLCRILSHSTNQTINIQTKLPFVVLDVDRKSLWTNNNPMIAAINLGSTVFVVDGAVALTFLNNYIPLHDEAMFRKPEKFVIISIETGSEARITDILKDIQNHPAIQEIANLLLIVPDGRTFELLTHRYVGNPPEALELLHLDTYYPGNRSFLEGNSLFPNKLTDLMGKTYRLASFYLLPWVMTRQTDDGIVQYQNQSYTIDGLDGYLLVLFCQRLNCTWELLIDQYWQYGQVFQNRTGNGMVGALVERKADFALAAVGAWHQLFHYFSFSIPIQWIGITCLQPRPTLIEYWRIIFMMFSKTVWALTIITFIVISLLDNYMPTKIGSWSPNRRGLSWSVLNVLCVFLLLPSTMRRSRASEVMISVALLAFTLIVAYVYIGKIHSILAIPVYEPPVDTIVDFAESGLRWNAPHEVWMYLIAESENPHIKQILTKFNVAPIPALKTIANLGVEPIVMAKLHFGHSMVGEWFTAENIENYRLMSDFLYYEYDTGYATKTWPLLGEFDHLSMWYRDGCLSRFVEQMDVFRYMNQPVQISIEHSRDRPPNKLKEMEVDEIEGGLLLLGIGYGAALVAFVVEMLVKAAKRKKLVRRFADPHDRYVSTKSVSTVKDLPLSDLSSLERRAFSDSEVPIDKEKDTSWLDQGGLVAVSRYSPTKGDAVDQKRLLRKLHRDRYIPLLRTVIAARKPKSQIRHCRDHSSSHQASRSSRNP